MKVLLNLTGETTNWLRKSRSLAAVIKHILEAQVEICQAYLQLHRVPPLYRAGVRYAEEPVNILKLGGNSSAEQVEEFACIPAVMERGWGDCDDLAPWRCAELREAGERAKIKIDWRTHPISGQKVYHVLVRRGDGSVEDPSLKLGMRS